MIDLRSDIVTRPSEAMRSAMADALVGDDGYGDNPTVKVMEKHAAHVLCLETSHSALGGKVLPLLYLAAVRELTRSHGIVSHIVAPGCSTPAPRLE